MKGLLNDAFREETYDFVYERYSLFSDAGLTVAQTRDVPLLLEVNAPLIEERAAVEPLPLADVAREVETRIFGAASAILAVSESMATYAHAVGAPTERVHIVPNGVDPDTFGPDIDAVDVKDRLKLVGRPIIVFAGSLKAWHGVDLLLEAYAAVSHPGWHLVLVGEGPQRDALEAQAASLRSPGQVTFTGAVRHEVVALYLAAADIAVAPYRHRDKFYFSPLKVVEYLAAGKPVIASDIGQIADMIRHGENGYLVPPDDVSALRRALALLSEDKDLRKRLARNAPRNLTTWQSTAQRVLQIARAVQHQGTTA
jgi:glycosyltransferase involved in cell wall biosynthesis